MFYFALLYETKEHAEGKLTLKTHEMKAANELVISPSEILSIRENFTCPVVSSLTTYIHQCEHYKIGNQDVVRLMDKRLRCLN